MPQSFNNSLYDIYTALRYRRHRNGLAMMPVAGIFPKAAQVVALNGGLDNDLISWVAGRRGAPPVVPAPFSKNPNRVFMGGEQIGQWANPDMSGVMTYYLAGWYRFGILSPEGLASDFMLGMVPFPGLTLQDQYIPRSYFQYGLINDQQIAPISPIQGSTGFEPVNGLVSAIIQRG